MPGRFKPHHLTFRRTVLVCKPHGYMTTKSFPDAYQWIKWIQHHHCVKIYRFEKFQSSVMSGYFVFNTQAFDLRTAKDWTWLDSGGLTKNSAQVGGSLAN
jgi:hypothetical protein